MVSANTAAMPDVIFLSQSQMVRFEDYDHMPLERVELYQNLVQLRSAYFAGGFKSHLDLINIARSGKTFHESDVSSERRELLDIWQLPGLNGILVASQLLKHGFSTGIINHVDAEWDRLEALYKNSKSPPLVAISTTFHLNYSEIRRLTKRLRALDPNVKIVVGGAFINEQTINGTVPEFEQSMRKYGIQYVLHGFNSESDLIWLVKSLKSGSDLDKVPNLAWVDDEGRFGMSKAIWHNPTLGAGSVLWDKLDLPFLNKTVQLRTASGCPFDCSFCSYPETAGGHFATDTAGVKAELDRISRLSGIEQVIFIDDTFNVPIKRFKEILKIVQPYGLRWYSFLRCQYIDDYQARLMMDSGCAGVYLGIESANDEILKNMHKRASKADFQRGIELLRKYDIPTFVALVIGFPGETEETIEEGIKFIDDNEIDFYSLKEFYYMPHTTVHKERDRFGLTGMGSDWCHDTMSSSRASEMKLEMFKRIKNSVYIDADTSLWYIAYLRDQGFGLAQIKDAQRIINRMMSRDNDSRYHDKDDLMLQLKKVVNGN